MAKVHKVCHILRRFNKDQWGGTESVAYHISRQLVQKGVKSPIFCTNMFAERGLECIDGIPVHRHSYTFPWFFLDDHARAQMQLKGGSPLSFSLLWALAREPETSLIHTHVHGRLGGIARSVARWKGIPYVVTVHAGYYTLPSELSQKMMQPFEGKWEWGKVFGFFLGSRRTLEDADAVIAVGMDEYEILKKKYPHKSIYHIPNGVDTEFFQSGRAKRFRDTYSLQGPFVLCVSRIDDQKNQLCLLRAFATFHKSHPEYQLVLIGPVTLPSYLEKLLSCAETLGVGKSLKVIEGISPDDPLLADAYSAASFFVLPSSVEPFGIVILEAWAAGTPVIASKVGGIPGFTKDEENVLWFEADNDEMLVEKMSQLAGNQEKKERLTLGGKKAVESYGWDAISEKILAVYEDVIEKKKSALGCLEDGKGK